MNQLIEYLYQQYIAADDPLCQQLSSCKPIPIKNLSKSSFNTLTLLIIKNVINYDQSTLKIQLESSQIFLYQRIAKIKKLFQQNWKDKTILELLNKWIQNRFLPFYLQKEKYYQKSIKQLIENKILYQDYTIQNKKYYMFQVPQLTKLLTQQIFKQKYKLNLNQMKQQKQYILKQKQRQKIQQYIIQIYGNNCLLILNIILKDSFISQKQLLGKSLMEIIQLRKCINILIESGLLSFYQENVRTIIYQSVTYEKLKDIYINHISKAILNIYSIMPKIESKQKLIQYQSMIQQLDDILLIFGY